MEAYGILLFTGAILGQFSFLEIGLGIGLEKFIPEFKLKQQSAKISQAIVATAGLFLMMGLLVSIILLILVKTGLLGEIFKVEDIAKTESLVLLACVFAPITWGGNALLGSLKGFNQHHSVNIINSIIRLLQFIIITILAFLSYDVIWLFLSLQLFEIIRIVWFQQRLSLFHQIKIVEIKSINAFISTMKQIFGYSIWVFVMQLSGMLVNQFDKMIVSMFIGIEQLVIYTGVVRLMKILTNISGRLTSAVIPIAAELNTLADSEKFNKAAMRGVRMVNAIAAPITALALIFAEPILQIMGKNHLLEYELIYKTGILIYMIAASRSFLNKMLIGAGDIIRFLSLFSVITSIVYFLLAYYLINIWDLSGAILALPFTHLLLLPIWLLFVKIFANVKLSNFLLAVWKGQSVSLIIIVIFIALTTVFPALLSNCVLLFITILLCLSLLALFSWWYTIDDKVKEMVLSFYNRLLKV